MKRFGGGKPPTGTPSMPLTSIITIVSLLGGASIVHNIYKPDLTMPSIETIEANKQEPVEIIKGDKQAQT